MRASPARDRRLADLADVVEWLDLSEVLTVGEVARITRRTVYEVRVAGGFALRWRRRPLRVRVRARAIACLRRNGLSQVEVAAALRVSQPTVSDAERRLQRPDQRRKEALDFHGLTGQDDRMDTITTTMAKAKFSEVIRKAQSGNPFEVTRSSRPVAVILPISWPRWRAMCSACLPGCPGKIETAQARCENCGKEADFFVPGESSQHPKVYAPSPAQVFADSEAEAILNQEGQLPDSVDPGADVEVALRGLETPVYPRSADIERASSVLYADVDPGVACVINHRLGKPLGTASDADRCSWGIKHGCACGTGKAP